MSTSARAPLYDLFKLIMAILLLLLFLFLLWGQKTQRPLPAPTTATPLPTPIAATSTPTSAPLTATPSSTVTSIPTTTDIPTLTATVMVPSPTAAPVSEALPTPIVEIPADINTCEATSHSQLQVGMQAAIVHTVNFRSSPGIFNNWIRTNTPNMQVEIIGGPTCTRYQNGGAYLWWQVKLPDGQIGWSAEASAFGKFYFMEPVK